MAEDNQKIEIKTPAKPINNCREVYLAENEKNILGPRGFKFSLRNDFSKKLNASNNNYKSHDLLPEISIYNKNTSRLIKSKSQVNLNNKSNNFMTYRAKNYNKLNNLFPLKSNDFNSNNNILSSLSFPISNRNISNFSKGMNTERYFRYLKSIKLKKIHKFNGLKILKNKRDNIKSYFKGVESVFISPQQIYDVLKDNNKTNKQNDFFDIYDNNIREKIEQNNEYKEDQISLLNEEKAKDNLINSKDFYNYLINKEYFFKTQINTNLLKERNFSDEKENFKKKMNYLKKIAFPKESNIKRNSSFISFNIMKDKNKKENNETNNSRNEDNDIKKKKEDENIEKVRIDGKTYILRDQIDEIAKKILNKCKVYNEIN